MIFLASNGLKALLHSAFIVFILTGTPFNLYAQHDLCGNVNDENGRPMPGAYVSMTDKPLSVITGEKGEFCFKGLPPGIYHLHISYMGYQCMHECTADLTSRGQYFNFQLFPEKLNLPAVEIHGQNRPGSNLPTALSAVKAGQAEIRQNLHGSLMKSLENLPGVKAMEIGQGTSKPVIRGLGFNRVIVVNQGIKQEGQQWGADHGLEVDPFAVESAEILKGPASLMYGSDALGGAVILPLPAVAAESSLRGSVDLLGRSVNNTIGGSLMLKGNRKGAHFNLRYSHTDYGDYKIPADSFYYNQFRLPVYDRVLKNTAGSDKNLQFVAGYIQSRHSTSIVLSHYHSLAGFFPGSHGIPDASKLFPDSSGRNTGLPYQDVTHRKAQINTTYYFSRHKFSLQAGLQHNLRQEWSKFHTHYPNQKPPDEQPDKEIELHLKTISANATWQPLAEEGLGAGINFQHQGQNTGGYMFLMAPFRRTLAGGFLQYSRKLSENLTVHSGIRYDYGSIRIDSVFSVAANRVKSNKLRKGFNDLTWSAGLSYLPAPETRLFLHIGKGFRIPTAMELSANGIHHGSFRYELGDATLQSEQMYQVDAGYEFRGDRLMIALSPFISYFPDYIFLSPTGGYLLPDGSETAEADAGQVYVYKQSEALRTGFEIDSQFEITPRLFAKLTSEYVYATDFTYPLPFTPPTHLASCHRVAISKKPIG